MDDLYLKRFGRMVVSARLSADLYLSKAKFLIRFSLLFSSMENFVDDDDELYDNYCDVCGTRIPRIDGRSQHAGSVLWADEEDGEIVCEGDLVCHRCASKLHCDKCGKLFTPGESLIPGEKAMITIYKFRDEETKLRVFRHVECLPVVGAVISLDTGIVYRLAPDGSVVSSRANSGHTN